MKITIYDSENAPEWVQFLNGINLFLVGFAVGKFWSTGLASPFISWFTLYACIYTLTIGRFFIPKKTVAFPGYFTQRFRGFFRYIKERWSVV